VPSRRVGDFLRHDFSPQSSGLAGVKGDRTTAVPQVARCQACRRWYDLWSADIKVSRSTREIYMTVEGRKLTLVSVP
jgi:hypothetical protein